MGIRRFGYGAAAAAIAAAAVLLAAAAAATRVVDISTFHLDGAFQTASGLFRLADGQVPGRDFQPYLGIGVTYLLFPAFWLAGADMFASGFTAHAVVALATALGTATVARLVAPRSPLLVPAAFGTAALAAALWTAEAWPSLYRYPGPFGESQFLPGNSLRPLRAFLPYAMAAVLYLAVSGRASAARRNVAVGCAAGASLLWSNDFGIPTAAMLGLAAVAWSLLRRDLTVGALAALALSGAGSAAAFALVVTHGNPLPVVRYALGVSHDQYWYFGGWAEATRLFGPADFLTKFVAQDVGPWGLVLVGVAASFGRRRDPATFALLFLGATVLAGGALATVGGHRGYTAAFHWWAGSTLCAWVILRLVPDGVAAIASRMPRLAGRGRLLGPAAAAALVLAAGGSAVVAWRSLGESRALAAADPERFLVPELGGYLPTTFAPFVDEARASVGSTVLEEYWGLWSALLRKHPPAPVDAVIHALGDVRGVFGGAVRAMPDRVLTTRLGIDWGWQPWNVSANWWFYGPLLENYRHRVVAPTLLLWERADNAPWAVADCVVPPDGPPRFRIDGPPGLYEVRIAYEHGELPSRALLMVENRYNYADDAHGYLSLDPDAREATFPVAVRPSQREFGFKVVSASPAEATVAVTRCAARKVETEREGFLTATFDKDPTDVPVDFNEGGFSKGIYNGVRRSIAFEGSEANRSRYLVGSRLRLADGSVRTVTRAFFARFLRVEVDGPELDPTKVGFPHRVEVVGTETVH